MASITNYANNSDWFYIMPAILLVDLVVILIGKYPSSKPIFGAAIIKWYDEFGLAAVAADVLSIAIGIAAARYLLAFLGFKGILAFLALLIAFQLAHDIFFYVAIIQQMPSGYNRMIDVFKEYGAENGSKILVADALMMLVSVGIAIGLKSMPAHVTVAVTLVTVYAICYAIYTRTPKPNTNKIAPEIPSVFQHVT